MDLHRELPLVEASQVGDARRVAVRLADEAGFDDTDAGRVGLVATELSNNLFRHARRGRLLLAALNEPGRPRIELIALDDGPGMASVECCLQDGYSTAGTPGTGLGAVRRVADHFEVYSSVPQGTVLLAQVGRMQDRNRFEPSAEVGIQVGRIAVAAPGESVSGDLCSVWVRGPRLAIALADGLGHGPIAAEAARAVCNAIGVDPFETPVSVLQRAHAAARSTRGAALAMAVVDAATRQIQFVGAGNVVGRMLSGVEERTLLTQHGTVGLQMRRPEAANYAWPPHALFVMHTDGIATRWGLEGSSKLLMSHPTLIAAWVFARHARGRDDATVVVVRHV